MVNSGKNTPAFAGIFKPSYFIQMKLTLYLLVCLLLSGCSAENISADNFPRPIKIFGKWKMESYADGQKVPFDVTIELKDEIDSSGRYIITGKSPLNFYFSTFELYVNSKGIKLYDIQITKVEGSLEATSFENNYYKTLSNISSYELSNDGKTLKLLLPQLNNQYIIYSYVP